MRFDSIYVQSMVHSTKAILADKTTNPSDIDHNHKNHCNSFPDIGYLCEDVEGLEVLRRMLVFAKTCRHERTYISWVVESQVLVQGRN